MTKGQKENDKSNTNKIMAYQIRSKNKKQNLVSTIFHDFFLLFPANKVKPV